MEVKDARKQLLYCRLFDEHVFGYYDPPTGCPSPTYYKFRWHYHCICNKIITFTNYAMKFLHKYFSENMIQSYPTYVAHAYANNNACLITHAISDKNRAYCGQQVSYQLLNSFENVNCAKCKEVIKWNNHDLLDKLEEPI